MKKTNPTKAVFFFILIFIAVSFCAQAQEVSSKVSTDAKLVKAIEVVGNKTISVATILSRIKTRVGQKYLQNVISDDLKRLYNTGYFSDVRVDRKDYAEGLKLFIYVDEKPIIEEVTFSKTRFMNYKTLKRNLKTQVGKFLDNKVLRDDTNVIKDMYAKKGLMRAEVEVESFVDEVTNKASLHFIVREGHRIRIKRINVYGNDSYPDKRVLKIIRSRYKWILSSGYLKEELLEEDMERIVSFYEQNGFIDANANYSTEYLFKGWVEVNIQLDEGQRYYVGDVSVAGNSIVSDKEIYKVIEEMEPGNIFSRQRLAVDVSNIRTLYFDRGYIFANVEDSTALDSNTGEVELKVDITEGGLAYIEKVKIQGNTRTRDTVVRRELKMFPGDRSDGGKLRRSKERLSKLGYFEDVSFDIEDTDDYDRKDLVVQVKEAKTGQFSFGGGFSTVDQMIGFIEVEQRNFDFTNWPNFTGGGQQLQVRAETGSTRNNLLLSFTEPWVFDYPVSGGFDLYRKDRDRERDVGYAYDELRVGGDIRFGKRFSEYVEGGVIYRNERITIGNLETGVSADLTAEAGENTVSSLGFSLEKNTLDSNFSPTKGYTLGGSIDIAGGPIGGDKDFYRLQGNGSYYVLLKAKSVLEFRLQAGIVDDYGDSGSVPIFERFFAGGARTIRGYDERKVGPIDSASNDPIGGGSMVVANVEYTIPVIDFIKLAVFFDAGNVWPKANDIGTGDIKTGVGVGARIKTPVGPINLDYGYPLNDEPGEDGKSGKFYFSISRGF
ncbi:MAG: outer membrane protein assembly factor BamA [Candidatus Zapsychrus exili]|nr:outer membrane protein assembly factor BamA [Candidatus Zapsychrus exili]